MTEQAKKTRLEYQREWRKKNPNKAKEYINRYWEKKAAASAAADPEQAKQPT